MTDPQWDQVYSNKFGPPIGRPGNGLGDIWGGANDGQHRLHRQNDPGLPGELDTEEEIDYSADLILALECLTPKQRFVIELRYGLRDGREYKQEEIAQLMGIKQPQVARLEDRAIKRMKNGINIGKG